MATLIIYLNDDFSGGETTFDFLNIKVKPEKGSALFFNYDYNTNIKTKSKHGGLPVLEGTKYIITCWIREKPIMLYGNNQ
jgi:prolyl 4-hydroxylase